jgi:hypothetical protein
LSNKNQENPRDLQPALIAGPKTGASFDMMRHGGKSPSYLEIKGKKLKYYLFTKNPT